MKYRVVNFSKGLDNVLNAFTRVPFTVNMFEMVCRRMCFVICGQDVGYV